MTAGFEEWETSEDKQASKLRLGAVGVGLLAAAAVTALLLFHIDNGDTGTDWSLTVGSAAVDHRGAQRSSQPCAAIAQGSASMNPQRVLL